MRAQRLLFLYGLLAIASGKYAIIKKIEKRIFDPQVLTLTAEIVNRTLMNINVTVLQVHNTKVLCSIRLKSPVRGTVKSILNWNKIDFCKFLTTFEKDRVQKLLFSKLFQGTFVHTCPVKEGFFFIRNAYFDNDLLRLLLPRGEYVLQFDASSVTDGIKRLINTEMKFVLL